MQRVARIAIGLAGMSIPTALAAPELELVRSFGDPAFKHAESLTHIEELPGGRLLASAEDGAARIWDLKTGEELQRFSHGDDDVWNAIPLQDGKHVATAGQKVRIWEIATGKMVLELVLDKDIRSFAIHPDGVHWVAVCGYGHTTQVVLGRCDRQARKFEVLQTIDDPHAPKSAQFSLDGRSLITGNRTATLCLYRFDPGS